MKLITLNIWCGTLYEPLKTFIESHAKDTDIFCFQEVRNGEYINQPKEINERVELFNEMKSMLLDFTGYFSEMAPGVGIATFIRNDIKVEEVKSTQILTTEDTSHIKMPSGNSYYPRLMQSTYTENPKLIIHNFHGIPGRLKKDTPERELQTNRLLEIINKSNDPQILVGDFNLDLNTEAITKLENSIRNLIKENGVKLTRNSRYKDHQTLPFADYIFISKNIEVKNFEVLQDEVSDHLALLLEFK